MIGQAEMDRGTLQTGSKSFNKFFVMQCKVQALEPIRAIIAEKSGVCLRLLVRMNEHFHCLFDCF